MIQSEIPDTCQLAVLIIYHTGNICNITDSFIWRLKIVTHYKLIKAIVIHLNNVFFKSNSKTIQFYYLKFMCFHEKSLSSIFDDLLLCCTQFSVPSKHLYHIKLDSSIWLQVKRPSMPTAQWFWKVNCSFSKYHSTTWYFKEDIVFLKEISQKLQFSSLGVGGLHNYSC